MRFVMRWLPYAAMETPKHRPPHPRKEEADREAASTCCVHEAALEVLAAPVGVIDLHSLRYANKEMRQLLGLHERVGAEGHPISVLVAPGHSEALLERRRLLLERQMPVRNSPVKLNTHDGYGLSIVTDTEPITFGRGQRALVQLFRSINGIRTLSYSAPILPPREVASARGEAACLHEAAFEALPIPGAILEAGRVVSANRQSRLVLGDDWAEGDLTLEEMLHADFLETGEALLNLALHNLHATRGCRAKFKSDEGSALYATLDAMPIEYAGARYAAVFALGVDRTTAR